MIFCDYSISDLILKPFPYVMKQNFIEPDLYQALKRSFPTLPKNGGRTGYSLYQYHSEYEGFLNVHSEWKLLYDSLMSAEFIEYVSRQFKNYFVANGCKINPVQAKYVDFTETADMCSNRNIDCELSAKDLFVRVDVQQGKTGYQKKVHVDFIRRFASCLIYFSEADEIDMRGGEFGLYTPTFDLYKKIPPQDNLAIIFPRWPNSFHSALPVTSTNKPRNFLYVAISSTVALWPE